VPEAPDETPRSSSQRIGSAVYWFSRWCIRVGYDLAFSGEVAGAGHIPSGGGFIVASNHLSFLDPPLIGCHIPHQLAFFARKTLWKPGLAAWWLTTIECIPVDRDGGSDVSALRKTISSVAGGRGVILFPEGTRSPNGQLQEAKPGVGMLACKTGAPVVPARIFGSYEALGKGRRPQIPRPVDIVYGRPLLPVEFDPGPSAGKARYQIAADRILAAIAALQRPVRPVI
jgi:1-acyl-sn-glycerol-3-phosphate acyltransferase